MAVWILLTVLWVGWAATQGGLELRRSKNGQWILFLPLVVYNLCALFFCILNYLINNVCYVQFNGAPEWDSPNAQKIEPQASKDRLTSLRSQLLDVSLRHACENTYDEAELVQLFDTLKPAEREELTGKTFRGQIVRSGCFLDVVDRTLVWALAILGFAWNKRYRTQHVGDPLLLSWNERLFFPMPIWGNVGMTSIMFRGKHQATMNYDHQPWQDHFRVLDDGKQTGRVVYLGLWTAREKCGGWFTLTVREDVETV